jgi:hypothetical protein
VKAAKNSNEPDKTGKDRGAAVLLSPGKNHIFCGRLIEEELTL